MKAYEAYRLDWMKAHGYSLTDLIKKLEEYRKENDLENIADVFCLWEFEDGFNGEIWACEDEHKKNEQIEYYYSVELADKNYNTENWGTYETYADALKECERMNWKYTDENGKEYEMQIVEDDCEGI